MTYRSDLLDSAQRERIAGRLLAAEQGLLGASGTLASARREIERAVANRRKHGPGYPAVSALISVLIDAQALVYEAHGELERVDAMLDRARAGDGPPLLPDPPRLGHAPPADARSRRWWPAPFDPVGMLMWYLRYRAWWSALDLAEDVVHRERAALREREREVIARSEAHERAPILPPLAERG